MEQNNISLQYGIRRTPSLGEDGELSECVNLIPQSGELVNIPTPSNLGIEMNENEELLYIHETPQHGNNYIVLDGVSEEGSRARRRAKSRVLWLEVKIECFDTGFTITTGKSSLTFPEGLTYTARIHFDDNQTYDVEINTYIRTVYDFDTGNVYSVDNQVAGVEFLFNEKQELDGVVTTVYLILRDIKRYDGTQPTPAPDPDSYGGAFSLKYFSDTDATRKEIIAEIDNVNSVKSLGNMLVVFTDNATIFCLWKNTGYEVLGSHLPELPISFGLQTSYELAGGWVRQATGEWDLRLSYFDSLIGTPGPLEIYFGPDPHYADGRRWDPQEKTGQVQQLSGNSPFEKDLTNGVMALLNGLLQKLKEGNRFGLPFFVRYAYRMFDGSLIMASAPVLMTPFTIPVCAVLGRHVGDSDTGRIDRINVLISTLSGILDYKVTRPSCINELSKWRDLIQSLDIFISSPLYFYKQSGDIEHLIRSTIDPDYPSYSPDSMAGVPRASVSKYTANPSYPSQRIQGYYDFSIGIDPYDNQADWDSVCPMRVVLPQKTDEEIRKTITEESLFYKVASIKLSELSTERTEVPIEKGALLSLETRETLTENFREHDEYIFKDGFRYNNRLFLYSPKRKSGLNNLDLSSLIAYTNRPEIPAGSTVPTQGGNVSELKILHSFVKESSNNGEPTWIDGIKSTDVSYVADLDKNVGNTIPFLFLPDIGVTRICLEAETYIPNVCYQKETTPHTYLDGVYVYNGYESLASLIQYNAHSLPASTDITDEAPIFKETNKIFLSEVENPFVLSARNAITLDVSDIIGLATTATALSQGQFGQFPMYAFTTDGIWALEITSEGKVSARQPVSRDVCTNPLSITQLDGAVVFVTDQGLKIISGSNVELLSGSIDGYNISETFFLPALTKFCVKAEVDVPLIVDTQQFVEQVQEAQIVYDYANNLLHIFPDGMHDNNFQKHYVLSLDTREWSTQLMRERLITSVPTYPLSTLQMVQNDDNAEISLYSYKKVVSDEAKIGYALTRPLSLGDPLTRKALYDLRVVGQRVTSDALRRVAVYVSNDNIHWYQLKSLKALSAKYYRFLVMSKQPDLNTLSGLSVQYDYRYNHKMRGH